MKSTLLIKSTSITIFSILFVFLSGCSDEIFDGSITTCKDSFILKFDMLNKTISHEMVFVENDILSVSIIMEKGKLDLCVTDQNGNYIYKGNNALSGEFSLIIARSGEYNFIITGRDAIGRVSFILRQ